MILKNILLNSYILDQLLVLANNVIAILTCQNISKVPYWCFTLLSKLNCFGTGSNIYDSVSSVSSILLYCKVLTIIIITWNPYHLGNIKRYRDVVLLESCHSFNLVSDCLRYRKLSTSLIVSSFPASVTIDIELLLKSIVILDSIHF